MFIMDSIFKMIIGKWFPFTKYPIVFNNVMDKILKIKSTEIAKVFQTILHTHMSMHACMHEHAYFLYFFAKFD